MVSDPLVLEVKAGRFGPDGQDRRKRRRVKMSMPVHIRGGVGSTDAFEDACTTIDASRDGLLVETARGGYWVGQMLEVSLGCLTEPMQHDTAQRARVIRNILLPNRMSYAVALEFQKALGNGSGSHLISNFIQAEGGVLLVEPDQRIATLTRELLKQDGYRVVHAASAEEALEILLTQIPDVLLAGMEGGEINGQELCSILKTSSRLQHIPVILLTSSARPVDYFAGHRAGAIMCLAVPCDPSRLRNAVRVVAPPVPGISYTRQRKMPRYPFVATTKIMDAESGERVSARVTEISRKGCYVDVLNTLPVGTKRKLQIFRDSGTFMTKVRIIYVHERIGMGVLFVDTSADQSKVLSLWLNELSKAPS